MTHDIRWQQRFLNFERALERLRRTVGLRFYPAIVALQHRLAAER